MSVVSSALTGVFLPISNAPSFALSSPAPKNMALVSMVEKRTAKAHVNLCTRVKLLLVGREKTEIEQNQQSS